MLAPITVKITNRARLGGYLARDREQGVPIDHCAHEGSPVIWVICCFVQQAAHGQCFFLARLAAKPKRLPLLGAGTTNKALRAPADANKAHDARY